VSRGQVESLLAGFRDPDLARALLARINQAVRPGTRLMEVCGTHTVAISKSGLRQLVGDRLELVSGPGCPVCVTDQADLDVMVALARQPGVTVATFGDMMRVPGSCSSLELERSGGGDVRIVYSPLEAVELARRLPDRRVVFCAVGFETTVPSTCVGLEAAHRRGVENFFILPLHKLVPPALAALMGAPDVSIDGFIYPGHVSAVIGRRAYDELAARFGVPAVIAGFEPVDIMRACLLLADKIARGDGSVTNAYGRAVREDGNPDALRAIEAGFEPVDAIWRGLGAIPASGLGLRGEYRRFDIREHLDLPRSEPRMTKGCACDRVLRGLILPPDCPLFGKGCTPEKPIGPCMVSSEGSCAAYYRYDRHEDGPNDHGDRGSKGRRGGDGGGR